MLQARLEEAGPGPKYRGLDRLAGQRIEEVTRRGKFLVLPLTRNGERHDDLIIHLGMTGVLSSAPPARPAHLRVSVELGGSGPAPVILGEEQPDHSRLYFTDVRRFGRFLLTPAGDWRDLPTLHAMGPEPLGDEFTPESLAAAFARSGAAVKTYLLSQRPVAGLGNIYVDEALWQAGIHPLTPASEVAAARLAPLHAAIREVLTASIAAQGTTLNDYRTVSGGEGGFQEMLNVYGRTGGECRRCGAELRRIVLGGRSTHFCPSCQAEAG